MNKQKPLRNYYVNLEVINYNFLAELKTDDWKVTVERGDLRQEMATYLNMARRVTLVDLSTQQTMIEVFMGSKCETKANQWMSVVTGGALASLGWGI